MTSANDKHARAVTARAACGPAPEPALHGQHPAGARAKGGTGRVNQEQEQ